MSGASRVGCSLTQRLEYRLQDCLKLSVDLIIPKPQDAITQQTQLGIPLSVARQVSREAMLAAVDFDNEF